MKLTELFGSLIFVVMINAVVIAFLMECIKKGLFGELVEKGARWHIACNIRPIVLNVIAIVLSGVGAFISYKGGLTIGGAPEIIIYAMLIYIVQKEIDMRLVKKIINKICDKILNEI